MKVNVDFDCTPEEARRLMGLPDLTPLHDQYVASLQEVMKKGVTPDMLEPMLKSWAPMGDGAMTFWKKLFESGGKPD